MRAPVGLLLRPALGDAGELRAHGHGGETVGGAGAIVGVDKLALPDGPARARFLLPARSDYSKWA